MERKLTTHQYSVFKPIIQNIQENLSSLFPSGDINDRLLSLTGAAGTGKSYLTTEILNTILRNYHEFGQNNGINQIVVTAPTHKTVKVLEDMLLT